MDSLEIDTVVVGGGQAGLSASYYLKLHKINHVVIEQAAKPAFAWREQKWDSFCFVVPNWTINLPGGTYKDFGIDPDGFILRDDIVQYFENYIERYQLPIEYNTRVNSVKTSEDGWLILTTNNHYLAKNVIIATGFFQTPKIPSYGTKLNNNILQLHTSEYKNPSQLNEGSVLVVGTGQSGMQIAEEIYKSGKKVHISVGSTGRIPRRYRGQDIIYWWNKIGNFTKDVKSIKTPKERFGSNPQCTGIDGGHDITFHQFYLDGVSFYGHLRDISQNGDKVMFEDDLHKMIKHVDDFEDNFLTTIDESIEKMNLDVKEPPTRSQAKNAYEQKIILEFDLKEKNITNIIWGTGYNRDFSYIEAEFSILDEMGFPIQDKGVSANKGLFFHGMPWITSPASGLVYGVGKDAEYIVNYILDN